MPRPWLSIGGIFEINPWWFTVKEEKRETLLNSRANLQKKDEKITVQMSGKLSKTSQQAHLLLDREYKVWMKFKGNRDYSR